MREITFDTPVLKVKGLEVKFDTIPVSASLAVLIGNRDLAQIVQQLHYWTLKGYGEVIDGVRWFYKPIKEWIAEVFPTFTPYQLGKLMTQLADRGIIRREKLFTKHQIQNGDRFWWQPKNQTYYYSLSTEKLQELADNFNLPQETRSGVARVPRVEPTEQESAQTLETPVFIKTQILSDQVFEDTKDFDCSKNNTDITSIENISRDQSHPHLPCVSETKQKKNKQGQDSRNPELLEIKEVNSANPKAIELDTNIGRVEENINQNVCTNKQVAQEVAQVERPRIKTAKGTRTVSKRMKAAPWKDEGQFKRFYRALIEALPIVANARSPQGLAQTIIRQLKSGIPHSYWDDFVAGLPIGTSTKPEWEVEPGIPHPMFIEYLVEKLIKGNNSQTREQAMVTALNIASTPKQAIFFWKECKISLGNALDEAERHRKLGVKALPTPLWTKERPEPTIEEAAIAGTKIQQINNSTQASLEAAKNPQIDGKSEPSTDPWKDERPDAQRSGANPLGQPTMREMLAARKVKGFCKAMPKVLKDTAPHISQAEIEKEERAEIKPKTNIATMAIAEINDYLKDPILRKQFMPQLWDSNYELILDYLGQIIGVKAPPPVEE
jgi:hypothetical protein